MGSSSDERERSIHEFLGAGFVANLVLWREARMSMGFVVMMFSVWLVFERSGHTLLSLTSTVLLLLITILFLWSKAASLLHRPPPPLPHVYLAQQTAAEAAEIVRTQINSFIKICRDVALGKDSNLYLRVAALLFILALLGSSTDIISLFYTCLVVILTIPALYERFQDPIHKCVMNVYGSVRRCYVKMDDNKI